MLLNDIKHIFNYLNFKVYPLYPIQIPTREVLFVILSNNEIQCGSFSNTTCIKTEH